MIDYIMGKRENMTPRRARKEKRLARISLLAAISTLLILNFLNELSPSGVIQRLMTGRQTFAEDIILEDVVSHNVADLSEPLKAGDTALYWHIHKASGSSMKSYYACMGLALADESGIRGHENDTELAVWEDENSNNYVNVETNTYDGIEHAKELGLAESSLADVIFSSRLPAAMDMFNPNNRGRVFALFRHPIERAVSLYYYRQIATWEKGDGVYRPELANIPIEEFFERKKNKSDNNMIAMLLNKDRREPVTDDDLEFAKEILRTKVLVGLTSQMEESVERFDTYFGWNKNEKRPMCQKSYIEHKTNSNKYERVGEGSLVWEYLSNILYYDIQLYEYAVELFEDQKAELFSAESSGRLGLLEDQQTEVEIKEGR
mmetsp:Transcript_8504/g.11705  ORF Transcript_8504/g.11705 Transcript_8504/m.11705 type:complete len:376 (-) Transcript_8504:33-1160(-)